MSDKLHTWRPKHENGVPCHSQVDHHGGAAGDGAADAARQADDVAGAVAQAADAVQRLVDARPIIAAKCAHLQMRLMASMRVAGRCL